MEPAGRPLGTVRGRRRGAAARAARSGVARRRDRPGRRAPGALRHRVARRPPRRPRRPRRRDGRQAPQGRGRARRRREAAARRPARGAGGGKGDLRELSFGPATEKYRELGTLANLLSFNAINTLPTRNFSAASFEDAPRLAAEELHELRHVARDSCASCTIGCEHIYASPGGGSTRVEYENVFALGPLCGVSDPDAVLAASRSATTSASTRSPPAARSPGRWSAPSAA